MTISVDIRYDNSNSFTFNSSEISIANSRAQLIRAASPFSWNEDFADDTGFTFDSAKAEFVGGSVQQKLQVLTNSTFYNSFLTKDGIWGDGTLTGTLSGSATVSGGVLNLPVTSGRVAYSGANMPTGNKGCVRFTFTSNYNGAGSGQVFFVSSAAEDNTNNLVRIQHNGTLLRLDILDSVGATIMIDQTGNVFSPTAGVPNEIELNWDADIGEHRLFIDGVNIDGVKSGTGTIGAQGIIRVGDDFLSTPAVGVNGTIDDLLIFNTPQHTSAASYTPFQVPPLFLETTVELPDIVETNTVTAFSSFIATVVGATQWTVNGHYWTGAAWATSDGTFAQSSLAADINSNLTTHPNVSDTMSVDVIFEANNAVQGSSGDATFGYAALAYPVVSAITSSLVASMDTLVDFTEFLGASPAAGTSVAYTINTDGVDIWHDGANWVLSDGTPAESNTAAEIVTNKSSLPIDDGAQVKIRACLMSNAARTLSPELFTVGLEYDLNIPEVITPSLTNVQGAVLDINGVFSPINDAAIDVELIGVAGQPVFVDDVLLEPGLIATSVVSNGEFSLFLVPSGIRRYKFTLRHDVNSTAKSILLGFAVVPSQSIIDLKDLTFFETDT